jgi:putative colanic acid biosynthesis acetyltransferase WcaF
MPAKQDLAQFNNSWYKPGASFLKRTCWYFINSFFFNSNFPINGIKVFLFKCFGGKAGKDVIIKPNVNIKYPWRLSLGNHVWIGENVWIDNLDDVLIESNVCISQGALLLCGNHNFKKPGFDLITGKIILKEGSWIGAKCIVGPNVIVSENAILQVGSVATKNLEKSGIYRGNPATKVGERNLLD